MIAARLVNELMLIAVLVGGEGAEAFAASLRAAGAEAEVLGEATPESGFDLAILLAGQGAADAPETGALVAALAGASDRLLFVPLPLREAANDQASPALPELTWWFEIFAEHGYQPMVEFDADFVAAGAFLVDRSATAAESELAAFTDRLQNLGGPVEQESRPPQGTEMIAALRADIAALMAQVATLTAEADEAAASLAVVHAQNAGWDGLRAWVNHMVADPARDSEAALARDLPRLRALRGVAAPPIDVRPGEAPVPARQGWFSRLFGRSAPPAVAVAPALLEDTALVRASAHFDAAWYVASTPELSEGESVDPVFHYVLVGALRGADPGPWFDTAAYRAAHPDLPASVCPLVHAIRSGEVPRLPASE